MFKYISEKYEWLLPPVATHIYIKQSDMFIYDMEKLFLLSFSGIVYLYLFLNTSDPRVILIICILSFLAGAARFLGDVIGGTKFSLSMFLANAVSSTFFGWLAALSAEYFVLRKDETAITGLFLAAGLGGLFGREIIRTIPIILAKWSGKQLGIELTEKELEEIRKNRNQ